MTDIVDSKCRSELMARIRGRDTAPASVLGKNPEVPAVGGRI